MFCIHRIAAEVHYLCGALLALFVSFESKYGGFFSVIKSDCAKFSTVFLHRTQCGEVPVK